MSTPMNPYQPPRQPLAYSPYEATPEDYANALDQLGRQRQIRTPGAATAAHRDSSRQ